MRKTVPNFSSPDFSLPALDQSSSSLLAGIAGLSGAISIDRPRQPEGVSSASPELSPGRGSDRRGGRQGHADHNPALPREGLRSGYSGYLPEATLVILNGPPRAGKDHAARAIAGALFPRSSSYLGRPVEIRRISDELKNYTHARYGLKGIAADHFESTKDVPSPHFAGLTPRQAYIETSETDIKVRFGESALGDFMAESLLAQAESGDADPATLYLLPGAGCWPEVEPVAALFDPDRILLLRIEPAPARTSGTEAFPLTDYRGDLRELEAMGVEAGTIVNTMDENFERVALNRVADFLSTREMARIARRHTESAADDPSP